MTKSVTVNDERVKVDYQVLTSSLLEDNSRPSTKYRNCIAICKIFKLVISIDGKEFDTMRRFIQDGGCYSEKWLSNGGVWVNSEKKLIESFLN
mgnify:CR=1 FL=1